MKKVFLGLVALTTIVTAANAQKGLGIEGGVNFSNISGKDFKDAKIKTGFQAGLNYNIPVGDEFYVQPGVNFMQNGAKAANFLSENAATVHLNYIQIPVTFQYQPVVGNGKLILGVGPYVAMGVGKIKVDFDGAVETKYNWDDAEDLRRVDAGAKAVVGYQLNNGLSLNLNTNLGLLNLDKENDVKAKNAAFGFTLGFRL